MSNSINLLIRVSSIFIITLLGIQIAIAQPDPNDFNEKTSDEIMNETSEKKTRTFKLKKPKLNKSQETEEPKQTKSSNEIGESKEVEKSTQTSTPVIQENQPQVAQPQVAKPPVTRNQPKVGRSFGAKPPAAKPQGSPQQVKQYQATQPHVTQPQVTQPQVTQPQVTQPQVTQPQVTQPQVTKPQIEQPKIEQTQVEEEPKSQAKVKEKRFKKTKINTPSIFKSDKHEDSNNLDLNDRVKIDVGDNKGENAQFGIVGKAAPNFEVEDWWDENGNKAEYFLTDFRGQVLIIFCWADWCPACKSHGYDEMLALQQKYLDNPQVQMLAIQTVFEGKMQNTKAKVNKVKEKYGFKIPMAYDDGDVDTAYRSSIMTRYKTAGTPWFIVVDQQGKVVFNYHHLPIDVSTEVIDNLLAQ